MQGNAFDYLKADAYFHLLEYDLMNNANVLARKAVNMSTIAICIAIATLFASVILPFFA